MLVTTCGHEVNSIDDVYDLQIKGYDSIGNRVVLYQCFCAECATEKEVNNEIIHNNNEELEWVSGISDDPCNTLLDYAKRLLTHKDKEVSTFASRVFSIIEDNHNDHKLVTVRIDTNENFTLSLKDSLVTGIGKVIFGSISEAVLCLNSAHITWKRDDFQIQYEDFLQYCSDAATALKLGQKSFIKQDSSFMITVEVRK